MPPAGEWDKPLRTADRIICGLGVFTALLVVVAVVYTALVVWG
jgi:hypothetical protein